MRLSVWGLPVVIVDVPLVPAAAPAAPRKTALEIRSAANRQLTLSDAVSSLESARAQVERASRYVKTMRRDTELSADETLQIALANEELTESTTALDETLEGAAWKAISGPTK